MTRKSMVCNGKSRAGTRGGREWEKVRQQRADKETRNMTRNEDPETERKWLNINVGH